MGENKNLKLVKNKLTTTHRNYVKESVNSLFLYQSVKLVVGYINIQFKTLAIF